jgi:hypothetical protein
MRIAKEGGYQIFFHNSETYSHRRTITPEQSGEKFIFPSENQKQLMKTVQ